MRRVVADGRVADFVSEKTGAQIVPPFTVLGIERDGQVIAGAIFNCFTGPDIEMTIAGQGWTREFIRMVGAYVFDQLGCERVSITTEQEKVVGLAQRIGFQKEGLKRNLFGKDRHGVCLGALKDEWKYRP